jgi:preprotein translocase subunit SecE
MQPTRRELIFYYLAVILMFISGIYTILDLM